jgi:outer membrane murein-binding lipoprotein Lpp
MNQDRLEKFERMLKYQSNQVDQLQQQLLSQQAAIKRMEDDRNTMREQLEAIQQESAVNWISLERVQQSELVSMEILKRMKTKKMELAIANERLDFLLNSFQEEDRRLKGWEKLVLREDSKHQHLLRNRELRQADELFLISKFPGGSQ